MDLISKLDYSTHDKRLLNKNCFTYRTEVYLQQREKKSIDKSPPGTITTWKNLKYQKQILDDDQAEIDRVLSTIDSIHGTFNRSLIIPYDQIYSSLYGGDNDSMDLMKTFCQRQNHYLNYDLLSKNDNHDESNTQDISSSFGNFYDSDLDNDTDDEEEENKPSDKKNSYDSAYGSMIPKRQYSRESLVKLTQPWSKN